MSKENSASGLLPKKHSECYECEKRQVGCHSHCKAYLVFRDQKNAEAEARKKSAEATSDYLGVFARLRKETERRRKSGW